VFLAFARVTCEGVYGLVYVPLMVKGVCPFGFQLIGVSGGWRAGTGGGCSKGVL